HRDGGERRRARTGRRLQAGRVPRRAAIENLRRKSHSARAQTGLPRAQCRRRLLRRPDRTVRGERCQCGARVSPGARVGTADARAGIRRRPPNRRTARSKRAARALPGIFRPARASLQGHRSARRVPGALERRAQRTSDQRKAARRQPPGLSPMAEERAVRQAGPPEYSCMPDSGGAARMLTARSEVIALLALALVLGAGLRFYHLGRGDLSADEGASWAGASLPAVGQVVVMEQQLDPGKLPLYDVLLHGWIRVFR